MPTAKFWVRGLRHEDEPEVAHSLRKIEGVFYAAVNHEEQCAEVDFEDDCVTVEEIRAVIAALGYEAHLAG